MDIITKVSNHLVASFSSFPVLNLLPGDRKRGNRQPKKHRLKPLISLDVIFGHFLEGKIGHLFLSGKVGQPVQNLLQVTYFIHSNPSCGLSISECKAPGN